MPRPGSRPYECVRRAWHSDRHQPIRGSLIQEIFRVVNEIHSPATRMNKEWQDKLPVVVLKAEEIMYSKANSEAEYMDVNTLCERANDAIKTIIRLDKTTESGVSLQPCIEAALILGCTPRRATRSQRNSTPSYYLNTAGAEPTCPHSSNLHKETLGIQNTVCPFVSDYSKICTPNNKNSTNPCLKYLTPVVLETKWMNSKSSLPPEIYPAIDESLVFCPTTVTPSIYPLYYGPEPQSKVSKIGVENPLESDCCRDGPAQVGCVQDISDCCGDARNKFTKADCGTTVENSPVIGCDLSLRLGLCTHPPASVNNRWPQELEGFGSSRKVRNLDPHMNKVFSSFHSDIADNNSLIGSSRNWEFENGRLNEDTKVKRRKGVANHLYKETQLNYKAKLPVYHHDEQITSADPSKSNSKDPALCQYYPNRPESSPRLFQFSSYLCNKEVSRKQTAYKGKLSLMLQKAEMERKKEAPLREKNEKSSIAVRRNW